MDSSSIGKKGENIACKYLEGKGHTIVDRNFKVKSGEIDIISKRGEVLFFVEVKTTAQPEKSDSMMHQRPEENVHLSKMKKLSRAVQQYLSSRHKNEDVSWEFLVIAIHLDRGGKRAYVKAISDVLES